MKPVSACSKNSILRRYQPILYLVNMSNVCPVSELVFLSVLQVAANRVFQEVTLRLDVTDQERRWLLEQTNHVEEKSYADLKLPAGVLES